MAKLNLAQITPTSFKTLDDLKAFVDRICDGWASRVRCEFCGRLTVVVFHDFVNQSTNHFEEFSSETPVICEDCTNRHSADGA